MKAIETKGRILRDGSIKLEEPIDALSGEVRLVIPFSEDQRQEIPQKLSPQENNGIVTIRDKVAEMSQKDGPPVINTIHIQNILLTIQFRESRGKGAGLY